MILYLFIPLVLAQITIPLIQNAFELKAGGQLLLVELSTSFDGIALVSSNVNPTHFYDFQLSNTSQKLSEIDFLVEIDGKFYHEIKVKD